MFCVLWENCQNHLESLLFQKGQSVWKKISSRAVIQRCHCELEFCWIFCWGAKLIAAWNVSLLKDFGGMAWQITASDLPRPDKSVVYCGFMFIYLFSCTHSEMLNRKVTNEALSSVWAAVYDVSKCLWKEFLSLSPFTLISRHCLLCAQYNILKMTHKFQM